MSIGFFDWFRIAIRLPSMTAAAGPVAGPYYIEASEVYVPGAAQGQVYTAGPVVSQVYIPGPQQGEVVE
jgi:hypothetical protein